MRVLYLAPWSRQRGQLSRRGFLDEEIRALADAGVDAYVLSRAAKADEDDGRLHIRAVADSAAERRRTLRFLRQCLGHVPLANLAGAKACYRGLLIERRAAEVIAAEGIHLIHSYFGWPRGFGGLLAKAATGVPLVAGLRGSDVNVLPSFDYGSRLDPSFDRAFRRLLRGADITVSVSEFLRRRALELGAPAARARVLFKGVRLDAFTRGRDRAAARAALGLPPRPVLLAVSGLVPIKGLHQVLCVLATLRDTHDFSLVICGSGPELDALRAAAGRLHITDRVYFRGMVSRADIGTHFAAADIFVHGSLIEASGNALLEAMASGVPVVCTDAGGPREYVEDGTAGFVVPIGDAATMADRIRRLLDEPALRERLGCRARERAEALFSYDAMIAGTLSLYDELLAGRGTDGHRRVTHPPLATAS